jgi:hypothetical protein
MAWWFYLLFGLAGLAVVGVAGTIIYRQTAKNCVLHKTVHLSEDDATQFQSTPNSENIFTTTVDVDDLAEVLNDTGEV